MNKPYFEPDAFNPEVYNNITPRIVQANEIKQQSSNNVFYILIGTGILILVSYMLYKKYQELEELQRNHKYY